MLAPRTIVATLLIWLFMSSFAIAQSPVGFNISDARTFTKMVGKTADGCTNWFDSFPPTTGGYVDQGYAGLAYGSIPFAGGVLTATWYSATTFSGGSSDDSQQQLYYTYLDDGDGGQLVANDGIGASVTISGLSAWLAANQATSYQIRIYHNTNNSGITSNTTASIRLGAPNPANGSTQLTSLPVLETVSVPWQGDGGYPTVVAGGNGSRGYGDSSTNLTANVITITMPSQAATGYTSRGSLSAIKITAINSSAAPPTPLPAYGQAVTNSGPLAYWRLNELAGATIAADFFGNYNGAIGSNVTTAINGPQSPEFVGFDTNNLAVSLTGITNSYLIMPTFNLNTNAVTVTGWINPGGVQTDSAGVVFCRGGTTAAGLGFPAGGGNELRYTWNNLRGDISTGLIVPTNQWSFFALVVSPTGATLYLGTNGVLNSFTDSISLAPQPFDAPLRIGFDAGASNRLFNGGIDEIALYKRSLTLAQIQSLYIAAVGCLGNPSITADPTNQTVFSGTTATFSVAATGPTVLSYQWQVSTNGGATFANISNATNANYTTPATILPNNGNQYRAVVSGLCGTQATSAAATLTVVAPPLAAYAQAVTNSQPLAYWQLNEPSGTVAADFYGIYNGSIGSAVTPGVSGPQNPPFAGFDANNTAMQLNQSSTSILTMPVMNLNTNTVTIAGWVYPFGTQADSAGLIFCRGGTTTAGLNFQSGGGNGLRYTWNGSRFDVNTGLILPGDQWSFFALVVTPTAATVYMGTNGVLNSFTDVTSLPSQAFDAPLLIGYDPSSGSRLFHGKIDEITIHKRALTPIQIQQLYIAGAGCPGSPSITNQPSNQSVLGGSTATFSVAATGPTMLSYQWQISTNGGASFSDLTGATNATYTTSVVTPTDSGKQFRTVVSGLCGTPAVSVAATLTVEFGTYPQVVTNSSPFAYWRLNEPNGATVAADFFGVYNGTIGAAVTAGVSGPQNPPFAGFESQNTAMQLNYSTTSILTMPALNLNTNTVTITAWVNPDGAQADAAGLIFCRSGSTVAGLNFPPGSGGNELRYTWNGSRFDVSTGLVLPSNEWSFVALVVRPTGATLYMGTNGVLNSFTDSVSLPAQAFDASLLVGFDPSSGGRLFKGKVDEIAVYSQSLSLAQIQQLYVTGAGCPGNPSITNQPSNQIVYSGTTAMFSVAATGPTLLSYQWQVSTNAGASFADVAGATSANYTTPSLTVTNNGEQYRVVVSGLCGIPATSTAVTLTVNPPPTVVLGAYGLAVSNSLPIAYWRLDETNGATVAADFFGTYNGAIGADVVAGVSGPQDPPFSGFASNNAAMLFNGAANSSLTMPTLNLNTNTVTIIGWMNPTGVQSDWAGVVFSRGGTTIAGLNFNDATTTGTNELRYTWNGSRYDTPTGLKVPMNQWSFFALVVKPTGATTYLGTNGVLNSFTDNLALAPQAFDASLLIGSDAFSNRRFQGRIDEVAIYNRALTPTEIQQFYIAGAGCLGDPIITNQPSDKTVVSGLTATFSVGASGPTQLSYQWEISTNSGTSFDNLVNATNTSYTTPSLTLTNNGQQYRVVVSGLCGTAATSAVATLTVNSPASPLGSYGQTVTNNVPIAYWRLNETNGATVAADFFGTYHGIIGAGVTTGIIGPRDPPFVGLETNNTAMQLNYATNSILTMPALNLNTNTVTITGWINPTGVQADWAGIVFCRGGGTAAGLNFGDGGINELRYTWNGVRFDVGTGLIVPTNQWSFFALVVTPTSATIYMGTNGALHSFTDSLAQSSQAFNAPLLIGYDPNGVSRLFKGGIDEVAVFSHALTLGQIQQLYFSGAGCPSSPMVTNQPSSQSVLVGSTAMFFVAATGPTLLSYQWQVSTNGGASFDEINGATNTSYTTPATVLADDGNQYRAVVTGLCGSPTISDAATLTVSSSSLGSYPQIVTNQAPIAYWRLNEPNGATVAADFFGVYNGTIGGDVTAGVSGPQNPPFTGFEANNTAMQLNYTTSSILTMPALNLNTNTVTITGWINPTGLQADAAGLIFCRGGSTIAGLNFPPGGGGNELRYTWNGNRYDVSTGLVVPTNQWSFFALVVQPTGATLYLGTNGVLNSFTDSTPLPPQAFNASLLIGSDPSSGSRLFRGKIDEVAVYNRSLTTAEIQQLFITGAGCPGSPVVTGQPVDQSVMGGSTAMFSVTAIGPTLLSYQWQVSTNTGSSFDNIAGATNANYTTPVLGTADDGEQFRTVVSGLCGTAATSSVATLSVAFGEYPQVVTNNAPVAYWRLNEPNGATVAADFFGAYNGTIGAGVTSGVSGPQDPPFTGFETNNTAMQLNYAANSILTLPALNLNTNTVTIIGWINPTGAQADATGIIFCRGGTTVAGLNFGSGGNNELRYTWNGGRFDVATGLIVPTNQWSFFGLVVKPTGATLYLGTNGILNSYTDTTSLPNQAFDASLLVGYDPSSGSRLFNGRIDEIAVYNKSLTPSQIQQLYLVGTSCPGGPTVTVQPSNQTAVAGSTATFSVTATSPTLLTYQWQASSDGGTNFAEIAGANAANYMTPATTLGDNGKEFRVIVSGACGSPVTSAVATLSVQISTYAQTVISNTPLAYWRLNETNGASVAIDSMAGNNGTINAGVTAGVSGPQSPDFPGFESVNTAMQLNGSGNSYLSMPTFNLNTNAVTITGWINPTGIQADWAAIVFCRSASTAAGLNFNDATTAGFNELRYTWNGSRYDTPTSLRLPTNQWSFFALVVTPTNSTVYLGTNGVLNSFTDTIPLPAQPFNASLLIGRDAFYGRPFNGKIDEVAIYNHAIAPEQILQLFANTGYVPPPPPPLTPFETWQLQFFGCTDCVQAAASYDADGDGLSNEQEFLAGTDPTNALSLLAISALERLGDDIRITWDIVGGHGYMVQTNAAPGAGFADFSPLISIPSNATESTTNYLDLGGATNAPSKYYRIRLVP
ncbi:MAG TPA: LamG-like jellyroll fold domain-containing protein [Verrucomicrobiae bacterium]|nr:LamG-like jellyroll fold domain-containing protein [Verrucomicrobiae bacterium]